MNKLSETAIIIKARTVAKRRDLPPDNVRKLLHEADRLEALLREKKRLARRVGPG